MAAAGVPVFPRGLAGTLGRAAAEADYARWRPELHQAQFVPQAMNRRVTDRPPGMGECRGLGRLILGRLYEEIGVPQASYDIDAAYDAGSTHVAITITYKLNERSVKHTLYVDVFENLPQAVEQFVAVGKLVLK